jgi:hypothetical protein
MSLLDLAIGERELPIVARCALSIDPAMRAAGC